MPARTERRHPGSYSELGVKVFRGHMRDAFERAMSAILETERVKRVRALKESGAEDLLGKLKKDLDEGLDPELKPSNSIHDPKDYIGVVDDVYLELRWNHAFRGKINTLSVFALPNEDLLVEGAVVSLVPKSLWQSNEGKKVLEDIIRHSFENPQLTKE